MKAIEDTIPEAEITVEDFGIKEARALKQLLSSFVHAYGEKNAEQSDEAWLTERFMQELPKLSKSEAERLACQTVAGIYEFQKNRASLAKAREIGITCEQWFAEKASEAVTGISLERFSGQIQEIDAALAAANTAMQRTIEVQAGGVSQCINLDGFIAEQHHVNTFNAAAALADVPYRAERCIPESGATFAKNSFDIVIKDLDGRIVHQYQCKYGADAQATIHMIRHGNYNNQMLVVPPEQVEQVQNAFPGKTVVASIGGSDKVAVSSAPLSKDDSKIMQLEAQGGADAQTLDWNTYELRSAMLGVGKRAFLTGVQGAALSVGFQLAAKAMQEEPVDTEELMEVALTTGADTGIKAAVAGAVKVGAEKGVIKILPAGTPMHVIANFACVSIENMKILAKVAQCTMTWTEALDEMGCNSAAMIYGLEWGATGAAIGASLLAWIPIAGPILGGVVGGCIGYMAGSKFGETVYKSVKKAVHIATDAAKTLWNDMKQKFRTVKNGIRRWLGKKKKETY